MAKKISHISISLAVLLFAITGFSYLFIEFDNTTGFDSGEVASSLNNLDDELNDVKEMETTLTTKTDEQSTFEAPENTLLEVRASESGGIINLLSKNILTRFYNSVSDKFGIPAPISIFFIMLTTLTITFTFIRFIWGETKV